MKVNLCFGKLAGFGLATVLMVGLVASANAQEILFDLGRDSNPYRAARISAASVCRIRIRTEIPGIVSARAAISRMCSIRTAMRRA